MPSTKCEGLSYSTHFLKNRGSVIRNNFLEYRNKQAILFARLNDVYALFATNTRCVSCFENAVTHLFLLIFGNTYFYG